MVSYFKQKILLFFSLILGIGIFLWIGKIIGWEEIKSSFSIFSTWQGLVIILLSFLIALIATFRWKEIIKDSGNDAPFWQLFKIYLGGYSITYLFPILIWCGEGFRIYELSRQNNISWKKTFASVVIERILEWTVNIIIILFALFYFIYSISFLPRELIILFGLFLLFFIFIITFFYIKSFGKNSIIKKIFRTFFKKEISEENSLIAVENDVFDYFQIKNKAFQKGIILSFLKALVMQLRTWILILFLGELIGFLSSLSVLGFTYLSSTVPIPTALGSHEVIQYFAFKSLGIDVSLTTIFTMIIRTSEVIVSLLGIVFLLKTGFNFLSNKFLKNEENK